MASHRLKRSMRGAMAATAVAAAVGVSAGPAMADPQLPDNASEAAQQFQNLAHEAERVTEEKKKAEEDHNAKKDQLKRATDEATRAKAAAEKARTEQARFGEQVDQFANASYQGARLNQLSAMMASESPDDYLDRAAALDMLAKDNNDALDRLSAAVHKAESSEQQAQQARATAAKAEKDAARLQADLVKKKSEADAKAAQAEERFNELSAQEQDTVSGGGEESYETDAGSGAAGEAVQAALSQQGKPYVYGAKGPDEFDCSGLMSWAYQQAGVSIGGSTSSQVSDGSSVSTSDLKPGDILFFYSSQSHNGMYVGDGKVVHAPTTGQNVKVEEYADIGDVTEVRRIAG